MGVAATVSGDTADAAMHNLGRWTSDVNDEFKIFRVSTACPNARL